MNRERNAEPKQRIDPELKLEGEKRIVSLRCLYNFRTRSSNRKFQPRKCVSDE